MVIQLSVPQGIIISNTFLDKRCLWLIIASFFYIIFIWLIELVIVNDTFSISKVKFSKYFGCPIRLCS